MFDFFARVPLPKSNTFSPTFLAYIGDGIYEMCVRHYVASTGNKPMNKAHNMAKNYANAKGQIRIYECIKDRLSEKEAEVFRRGRNAKSGSFSKNLSLSEYKIATGLESVLGYLYINGELDRISELVFTAIDELEKEK